MSVFGFILYHGAAAVEVNGGAVFLNKCSKGSAFQLWDRNPGGTKLVMLRSTAECLDIDGYSTQDGGKIQMFACHPTDTDPKHQNQQFTFHSDGTITSDLSNKCLVHELGVVGSRIVIQTCSTAPTTKWEWNTDGNIISVDSQLCLDAGRAPPTPRVCDVMPGKTMPFCDSTLPLATRVMNLVSSLTTQEKVGLFGTTPSSPVTRLNLPGYEWWSEALHGVGGSPGVTFADPTPCATSFPQVIGTGATFNRTLWSAIGTAISTEARAFNNEGHAGLTFWAPNVNIFRDPRWGRGQETPGEDPMLTSEYAAHFVSAMQGSDKKYLKVSSCCKHYTAYDLENWGGVDRHHFNAIVSAQDMADTFMPPFQSCVQRARASSLMCSYNRVNGVPSCANSDIMTKLARQSWGFEGYITSDCGAVDDIYYKHKFSPTPEATCKVTLEAGMDIDCGGSFLKAHLGSALQQGVVKMSTVDERLTNLFSVQFRLGMFDPVSAQPYLRINYTDSVATPAFQELALQAARQSIVLLKNRAGMLPLKPVHGVAMVGPHADARSAMQGNYEGRACFLHSPFTAVKQRALESTYVQGCDVSGTSTAGFAAAKQAASNHDATVIVVGIDQSIESEDRDRTSIDLPGVQNKFIVEVASAAKRASPSKPVVVVYMIGGVVDMTVAKDSPDVDAVLWVGYPGQSGGDAIADVLFGDFAPAGRLPYTGYKADYVKQLSMLDMSMRPNASSANPGRTYRFFPGQVVYPFGSGLSYSTFTVEVLSGPLRVSAAELHSVLKGQSHELSQPLESKPVATVRVRVNNTGAVASDFVLLGFVEPPSPGGENPLVKLAQFERVFLLPKQSTVVTWELFARDLTLVDRSGTRVVATGPWRFLLDVPHSTSLECLVY